MTSLLSNGRRRATFWFLLAAGSAQAQDGSSYYTEPYQQKALEIFRTSISYRTAETHSLVPEFANYLANQFRAGGFPDEDMTNAGIPRLNRLRNESLHWCTSSDKQADADKDEQHQNEPPKALGADATIESKRSAQSTDNAEQCRRQF